MKNRIFTNGFRTIKKMFPRFLSLLIISFLGTFSFVGLQSTAPNMLDTLDYYYDQNDVYDIRIISTLGLNDNDLEALKEVENIDKVEGSYSKDVLVQVKEKEYVLNIESLPQDINKLDLIDGEFPKQENEIVVEENLLIKNDLAIGDTLSFVDETFKENNLKIVGVVNSHIYFNNVDLSQNRGTTSIGAGTINYYSYVISEAFNVDYYTSIYITLDGAKEEITSDDDYLEIIDEFMENVESIKKEREEARKQEIYDIALEEIEKIENKIDIQLGQLEEKINEFKTSLDEQKEALDKLKSELDENYSPAKEAEYNLKKQIYEFQLELYRLNVEEYQNTVDSSYEQIEKAKESINKKIPKATWHVLDRTSHLTYVEYTEDTGSISNLAKVFPLIFFAVAVLISLVSMNRMVEDDRTEIGTLKSLGFTNKHIIVKYILFAFLATSIGSILGSVLGAIIIPSIISSIYSLLFTMCSIYLNPEWIYIILGISINFICIILTTYLTVIKVLREKPSELMRPKAPKSGKRVFLERNKFIWKRLSFSSKVTIRNLFRYKRRAFVTILGVAGCTALMMCGFGVKDSIVDIPDLQFERVFTFDAMVYVQDYNHEDDSIIFENEKITSTIQLQNINVNVDDRKVTMFVVDKDENLDKFINLYDFDTKEKLELEHNKIAITKKLAELENISVGDKIEYYDKSNNSYEYEVSSIVENYMEHYIFIDSDTYELSEQVFNPNTVCIQTVDLDSSGEEELTRELLESDKIISISYVSELVNKVTNMLKSLDKVVLILIVLASLLSFVVLYNLSNINIHERKREISTLKVLGFYHKEVDDYINKENIILSIIGIAIGLVMGRYLTTFIIQTVEIEKGKFLTDIKTMSYIYSSLLTIIFTISVNFISHFILKKVNMIESMKSVE